MGLFIYNPFQGLKVGRKMEFPPVIQPFHILGLTIPTYSFNKNTMMYGQVPRSYPTLDFDGFQLTIELEEDEQGTVEYFINWNQRNIIDSDGYHNAPNKVKMRAFTVEVQDKRGIPVVYYVFHDLFYLGANDSNYSYAGNGSIKRSLTFACDRVSTIFTKQNIFARSAGLTTGLVGGLKNAKEGRIKR